MSNATIVKALNKTGIDAEPYARGPAGRDPFLISIIGRYAKPAGVMKVWQGLADVDLHVSKRHRQAVMLVEEPARSITRWVSSGAYVSDADADAGFAPSHLINNFAIVMPPGTTYTTDDVRPIPGYEDGTRLANGRTWRAFQGTVTATAPATRQALLVGIDETHHFVAALPTFEVGSVADAHRLLRPRGVPEGSPRQGEWFFVPASQNQLRRIERFLRGNAYAPSWRRPLEDGSHHQAEEWCRTEGGMWARGFIVDTRRVRHKPLHLDGWHRVVRNRETVVREAQRPQRWD